MKKYFYTGTKEDLVNKYDFHKPNDTEIYIKRVSGYTIDFSMLGNYTYLIVYEDNQIRLIDVVDCYGICVDEKNRRIKKKYIKDLIKDKVIEKRYV